MRKLHAVVEKSSSLYKDIRINNDMLRLIDDETNFNLINC